MNSIDLNQKFAYHLLMKLDSSTLTTHLTSYTFTNYLYIQEAVSR